MESLIGKQIDTFRVEALLGEGGMGAVYRARDLNLKRPLAIKIMHPHLARRPKFQRRFLQEAQAVARLDHPAIVRVYHAGMSGDLLYIAMEYVPGLTLGGYLQRLQAKQQLIQLDEALAFVAQIAEALGYAHQQGIIHRDVKPDNILLKRLQKPKQAGDPSLQAVVTDFGIAKLVEGGVTTQTGSLLGTLLYMAPEQLRGKKIDGRTDLYSLGILLYQLVTGHLPFAIKTPGEAIHKHLYEVPLAPRSLRPELPTAVENIILKAIAKQPNGRFQTGEAMAAALRQAATQNMEWEGATTTASQTVVSLVTQLYEPESFDPPPDFGAMVTAVPDSDQLIITRQGEPLRSLRLDKSPFTIGLSSKNDIQLKAKGVSRRHARLEHSTNGGWRVVDLGSTNGTYLAGSRLLSNIPQNWEPEQPLRIGSYFLRWQRTPAQTGSVTAGIESVSSVGVAQIPTVSGQLRFTAHPANVAANPGERVEIKLDMVNQGTRVDHFTLRLDGLPAEWVTIPQPTVQLMPQEQATLTIILHPPANASTRAGSHTYQLRLISTANPAKTAVISGQITISSWEKFSMQVEPTHLVHGRSSRIQITNEGNTDSIFNIIGKDPAQAIHFAGQQGRLKLAPGQTGKQMLLLSAKQRPWLGTSKTHPFTIHASTASGQKQEERGQLEVSPRLPIWIVPLFIFLCLGLAGTAAFFGNQFFTDQPATAVAESDNSTPDVQATVTEEILASETAVATIDDTGTGDSVETASSTPPGNLDEEATGLPESTITPPDPTSQATTAIVTAVATSQPNATVTVSPTATSTNTPSPTATSTNTVTSTNTPTATFTPTPETLFENFDSSEGFTFTNPERVNIENGQVIWNIQQNDPNPQFIYRTIPEFQGDVRLTFQGQVNAHSGNHHIGIGIGNGFGEENGISISFGYFGSNYMITARGVGIAPTVSQMILINEQTPYTVTMTVQDDLITLSVSGVGTTTLTHTYSGVFNTFWIGNYGSSNFPFVEGTIDSVEIDYDP